ncbi:MAG: VOC family protein [Thermoleophilia bacterium]
MQRTAGIHHVTAMASDPQRNRDFYEGVLGLRMVKRTVNFDDPGTYHLYYGDGVGSPGTILTFFPMPGIREAVRGSGITESVELAVPAGSLGYWTDRLAAFGVPAAPHPLPGGLALADPDGMAVVLLERQGLPEPVAWDGPVPQDAAIRGVDGVTLRVRDAAVTRAFMSRALGMDDDGEGLRAAGALGGSVRVTEDRDGPRARMGAGSIHHVAFRVPDGPRQAQWRSELVAAGANVSPVMDRDYFTSIYFQEPGGVILEIATDTPGFTRDEDQDALGEELRLPAWVEQHRERIEEVLAPLGPAVPGGAR